MSADVAEKGRTATEPLSRDDGDADAPPLLLDTTLAGLGEPPPGAVGRKGAEGTVRSCIGTSIQVSTSDPSTLCRNSRSRLDPLPGGWQVAEPEASGTALRPGKVSAAARAADEVGVISAMERSSDGGAPTVIDVPSVAAISAIGAEAARASAASAPAVGGPLSVERTAGLVSTDVVSTDVVSTDVVST
ncbi:MAG: hypothetical protein ABJA87_11190, partial [bacterium]